MPTLLFFAPIDGGIAVYPTPDQEIPEELIEQYGLSEDAQYEPLDHVWDVDADAYCVWRSTVQEACDVAMTRFCHSLRARYEDGIDWDVDMQGVSWEEFAEPFMSQAQELIDEILAVAG